MPLAPFSFADGLRHGPREAKPRAAVAGLLSVGIVGQDALKWTSLLVTFGLQKSRGRPPARTERRWEGKNKSLIKIILLLN